MAQPSVARPAALAVIVQDALVSPKDTFAVTALVQGELHRAFWVEGNGTPSSVERWISMVSRRVHRQVFEPANFQRECVPLGVVC